jgi:head-tail adaptor
MITAGRLSYRGIIQKRTDGQDARGGLTASWSQFAERRMRWEPLGGRESFLAQQTEAAAEGRLGLRYLAGVTAKMRILLPRVFDTLSAGIDDNDLSLTVASAEGFPLEGAYRVRIDDELLEVTAGQGTTTWTVTRAKDGTSAASHASGASVAWMVPLEIVQPPVNVGGRRRELQILVREANA